MARRAELVALLRRTVPDCSACTGMHATETGSLVMLLNVIGGVNAVDATITLVERAACARARCAGRGASRLSSAGETRKG